MIIKCVNKEAKTTKFTVEKGMGFAFCTIAMATTENTGGINQYPIEFSSLCTNILFKSIHDTPIKTNVVITKITLFL